jgi:phosphoserine phosphatase
LILYLVRHGQTESNRKGLALGRANIPLDQTGLEQARQLGEALSREPFVAVYSSPLQRAVQTAEEIASLHDLRVQVKPGLIEMNIGEADGLTFSEVRERFPGLLETWATESGPDHPMPGGERLADVQRRTVETVQSLLSRHPDETVCAVTHNFVILSLLTWALGVDLAGFRCLRHGVGAFSVLEVRPGRTRVRRMNDTCHLSRL